MYIHNYEEQISLSDFFDLPESERDTRISINACRKATDLMSELYDEILVELKVSNLIDSAVPFHTQTHDSFAVFISKLADRLQDLNDFLEENQKQLDSEYLREKYCPCCHLQ